MEIEKLRKKALEFKESFFWGEIKNVIAFYETLDGIFLLDQKEDNTNELYWAVNDLSYLKTGIEKMKDHASSIQFRCGGNYFLLLDKIKYLKSLGCHYELTHIGYRLDLTTYNSLESNENIKRLKENEIDEIMTLEQEIFHLYPVTEDEYQTWLKDEKNIILTIKKDGCMIGFMNLIKASDELCLIRNLGIKKVYRGQKYGETLLSHGLTLAKAFHYKKSFLWVDDTNKVAIHLYEKMGFQMDENEAEALFIYKFE